LKSIKPSLEEAFLRSDNAGCYHNAYIILSLPSIGKRTGIRISRYDFSEPQAGKDVCDRRIAALKSHMRRYLNEGNNIHTAVDMKTAIESYGGTKGCYVSVCKIEESSKTMTKHKMPGVQSLNNFEFDSGGVRCWKAYQVGPGKLFDNSQLSKYGSPQGPTKLKVIKEFSQPSVDTGILTKSKPASAPSAASTEKDITSTDDESPQPQQNDQTTNSARFSCPEEGCVKTYLSYDNLQKHLDVGKHLYKLERETSYDGIKSKWAGICKDVSGSYLQTAPSASMSNPDKETTIAEKGWGLKKTKTSKRFSQDVKSYLTDIFLQGEETGIKANPLNVATNMKKEKCQGGAKRFKKEEWLTSEQIVRYFSRLNALNRGGLLASTSKEKTSDEFEESDSSDDSDDSLDIQEIVNESHRIMTRLQLRRQLEL